MLIVTGIIEMPEDAFEAARPALRKMTAATLEEPGCIIYGFWQDPDNPGRLRVYEEWEGRAALDAHFASEHMAEFRAAMAEIGPISREIVAIEAGQVEPV